MTESPFGSARLCCCGHEEMHHVAARLRCPVVISIPPDGQLACSCLGFQGAERLLPTLRREARRLLRRWVR